MAAGAVRRTLFIHESFIALLIDFSCCAFSDQCDNAILQTRGLWN